MNYCYPKFMYVAFNFLFTAVFAPCLCLLHHLRDIFSSCGASTPFRVMASYHNHLAHQNRKDSSVRSARRRDLYLNHIQHSQQTTIHSPEGIRTHYHKRRAATDLRLRPRGHSDRFVTCDRDNVCMFILIILEVHVIGTGSYTSIGRVCVRLLAVFIYGDWPCLYTLIGLVYVR